MELWRTVASTLPSVADTVIQAIFPLCFTPEMYVDRPEFVDTLADFVRGRPAQPLEAFLAQTEAAMSHDASAALSEIGFRVWSALELMTSSARRDLPSESPAGSADASGSSSSTCRTPGCTRTPRPSTARRLTFCCANAGDEQIDGASQTRRRVMDRSVTYSNAAPTMGPACALA